jgi:hypothetical protein
MNDSEINNNGCSPTFIIIILVVVLIIIMVLSLGCSTYHYNQREPFARHERYGKYPTKKNIPVKNKTTWIFKQWGHEGR